MGRKKEEVNEAITDTFSVSISDLMSGLLAIFILVLAYFILNFTQATAQLTQNDVKRAELLESIHTELEKQGIKVSIDEKHGILRISEGVLFDAGMADIKPQGKNVIDKLSSVLIKTLKSEEYEGSVETIFIEGHTDNTPINNGMFPSNWELSTKRAINTWLVMSNGTPEIGQIMNSKEQPIFSVSGYSDTRPISDNSTDNGRGENRRIDIRFTMTPPSEDDMEIVKFVKKGMAKR